MGICVMGSHVRLFKTVFGYTYKALKKYIFLMPYYMLAITYCFDKQSKENTVYMLSMYNYASCYNMPFARNSRVLVVHIEYKTFPTRIVPVLCYEVLY